MLETQSLYSPRHINPLPSGDVALSPESHVYVHGGGFGMGTEVIADPIWSEILKQLEPTTFEDCDRVLESNRRLLDAKAAGKIILLLENSPVASAYARLKIGSHFTPELDIWIDPATPRIENAKVTHGSAFAICLSHLPRTEKYIYHHLLKQSYKVNEWFKLYYQALNRALDAKNQRLSERDLKIQQVCIDVKSPWTTTDDVKSFITEFQTSTGAMPRFVGSFNYQQVSDLPTGSAGILFFHGLWDLEQALQQGYQLPPQVMFNGADLLEPGPVVDQAALTKLKNIVETHSLNVGIYIQEVDASDEAVQLLIHQVMRDNPAVFKGGFVFGGRSDGKTPGMLKGCGQGMQKPVLSRGWLSKVIRIVRQVYRMVI